MGYSISWLAAHAPTEIALSALALRSTGRQCELPGESPIVGAALSSGWYVIIADRCDHLLIAEPIVQPASTKVDLVVCSIEEHVMCCAASSWSQGRRIWSVSHDAQQAADHLETKGQLPPFFDSVRDGALREQASKGESEGVDFVFDVPIEMAQRMVGFRHDAEGEPTRFDVLEPVSGSALGRPWWKIW